MTTCIALLPSFCSALEWIKIVLDVVRYDCPYMKEEGIGMLIASFNQQATFIHTLEKMNFIYCPRWPLKRHTSNVDPLAQPFSHTSTVSFLSSS